MKTQKAHCIIDLSDVVAAGSVKEAIEQWAKDSDTTSSGVVGSAFSTSGPGNGWSRTHSADDFASAAFAGGALYYIDSTDGRLKTVEEGTEGEEGAEQDIGGCWYCEGDWTDESEVELRVPDEEDALANPKAVAQMAKAVIDYHHHYSDRSKWAALVRLIKAAAEELESVDCDELEG